MGGGVGSDRCRRSRLGRLADREIRLAVRALALVAVGILRVFAPEDGRTSAGSTWLERRSSPLRSGALAWALSQIGPGEAQAAADAPAQMGRCSRSSPD